MIDINKLLGSVIGGVPAGGQPSPWGGPGAPPQGEPQSGAVPGFLSSGVGTFGAGALAGGLAGALLSSKHVKKFAGGALQMGAAAVLGGLAYKAYSDYKAGRPVIPERLTDFLGGNRQGEPAAPSPARGIFSAPALPAPSPAEATLVLRAMIAAAMADGRIDDAERGRLIGQVEASGLGEEEKQYLETLIARPDTPENLAAGVDTPEKAAEVFLAAYVAIDADTAAETIWLDRLAAALRIDAALRSRLEEAVHVSIDQAR